jgi:hypothetical protein
VKVIKNKDAFRRQARTEIRLLELLNKKDPDDQWCIGSWRAAGVCGWAVLHRWLAGRCGGWSLECGVAVADVNKTGTAAIGAAA